MNRGRYEHIKTLRGFIFTDVKNAIINELTKWLDPTISSTAFLPTTQAIQQALSKQHNIGWRNFVRGRLSMDWGEIINTHIQQENISNMNAEKWGTTILNINWKYSLQMWDIRNKETLGNTPDEKMIKKKVRVLNELQHIIDTNNDMPSHNLDLLIADEIEFEQMNENQVDNLLSVYFY